MLPNMLEQGALPYIVIGVGVAATAVEPIAVSTLRLGWLLRIARPYAPARSVGGARMPERPRSDGKLVLVRKGEWLVTAHPGIGRRPGAWGCARVDAEGRLDVRWAPQATFTWIPMSVVFGTYAGLLPVGGGSWLVALAFAGAFSLVAWPWTRVARQTFDESIWPGLCEALGVKTA